ncbi:MAG: membrane protein [Planctomycetaceae bacterium]|nr:MAG: membrane protein [Planctomycetaceae bacterium]
MEPLTTGDRAWWQWLPAVNASLNALATLLLLTGYGFIRRGQVSLHRRCMTAAIIVSLVFLGCYVVYHAAMHAETGEAGKRFLGTGWIRPVYFSLLISHVLLAFAVAVLAPLTWFLGWFNLWERHRQWARWTYPIWLYVSITGVLIYIMLYHWPQPMS